MAGSVNKAIIVGNLGGDPEVRQTQDGRAVANMTVATNETWKDRTTGEKRERTEWHRVAIFSEGLVRIAEQYLRKGSKVYLEGQIRTRKWQDKTTGQDRYSTEIVLQGYNSHLQILDSRGSASEGGHGDYGDRGGRYGGQGGQRDWQRDRGGQPAGDGDRYGTRDPAFDDPSGDGDGTDEDTPF